MSLEESRREKIIKVLSGTSRPLSVYEIAAAIGIYDPREAKTIYEDLRHIAKTIRRKGGVLYMDPPRCANCGYIFKNLTKPHKPSKCPKCKAERITPPRFIIEY
ncbi:MAG: transcriptional regulator [Thermoprotei archaeon]|nr:MAG: transcriptional regulator [Thermoprotei archaeon]RLF00935.1 MAG: transcriptional regulator [Thermoprotei archaeon]